MTVVVHTVVMQVDRSLIATLHVLLTADQSIHSAWRRCAVVAKQSCCTVEDVEVVNVGALKIQAHSTERLDELYNFTQHADVGRASARA